MAINLMDYSKTAAQRQWGAGWPSCAGCRNSLVIVTADRSGARVSVHARISRLVDMLLDETERRGYLCKKGQTGAYNCRAIGGTNSPSNHSWGLAIDINWQDNPYSYNAADNHIPSWMPPLWGRYGFAWGGNYTGKKDYMHFEFMGSPLDADAMTALAMDELGQGGPDLTEEERAKLDKCLALLEKYEPLITGTFHQMSGSPNPGEWPGWPTWEGGSLENLTLVDYNRRNNVEVRELREQVARLTAKIDLLSQE